MSQKGPFVVGKVTMDMDITVEPALAAHHMWEASCEHLSLGALGRTPGEAVVSLGRPSASTSTRGGVHGDCSYLYAILDEFTAGNIEILSAELA